MNGWSNNLLQHMILELQSMINTQIRVINVHRMGWNMFKRGWKDDFWLGSCGDRWCLMEGMVNNNPLMKKQKTKEKNSGIYGSTTKLQSAPQSNKKLAWWQQSNQGEVFFGILNWETLWHFSYLAARASDFIERLHFILLYLDIFRPRAIWRANGQ